MTFNLNEWERLHRFGEKRLENTILTVGLQSPNLSPIFCTKNINKNELVVLKSGKCFDLNTGEKSVLVFVEIDLWSVRDWDFECGIE